MANRFPLIIDSDEQKIKELPSGDNLDLTNNDISAVRNIFPEASELYDLGSDSLKWRDLYLSGNSINLGNLVISYANNILSFLDSNSEITFTVTEDGGQIFDKLTVNQETTLNGNTTINGKLTVNGVNTQTIGSESQVIEQYFGANASFENITVSNNFIANSATGSNGDFLASSPTGVYWTSPGAANNVLYVSESGDDDNNGLTLDKSFRTIAAAVNAASSNTTIFVKSGDYTEQTPIVLPERTAIVGDNLRTVSVRPANTSADIFHVTNACYITGITFRDHANGAAAVAFPDAGGVAGITSPYIQNCSSITTDGVGMRVDGSKANGLKSMVSDSYTQFNSGGIGVHILNGGYSQLVSIFTICCDDGILCSNGGFCSITNSNNSFGNRGLRATGIGSLIRSATVSGANQSGTELVVDGLAVKPNVSEVIQLGSANTYYTIAESSNLVSNTVTLTLLESIALDDAPADDETVTFYQRSLITSSSHTFEFVGTGTDILTATPSLGGVPVQENEVVEEDGGKVNYTSTDQWGDFRIGDGLLINNAQGVITGESFDRGLFAVLTPYILALES